MGDVMGDLSCAVAASRHGGQQLQTVRPRCRCRSVRVFNRPALRTQGRRLHVQFDSYQQVPDAIASEIIKRVRGE